MRAKKEYNQIENKREMPLLLVIWWWASILTGGPLYIRLLWEQTFLTWTNGRQMVGFSLLHLHPNLFIIGICGQICALIWLLLAFAYYFTTQKQPSKYTVFCFTVIIIAFAIALVPYDFWVSLGGVE